MTTQEHGWQDPDDFDDEADEIDEIDTDELEQSSGGALREQLVGALARIKELEEANEIKSDALQGKLMDEAFEANGLKLDEGIGKAVALGYDGKPDAEALAQHLLEEYSYEWTGAPHPYADTIALGQAQLDQIGETAGSVPSESPWNEELARAEAARDTDKSMAMKAQQITGWFRR